MDWKNIITELRLYPAGVLEEVKKVDWPHRKETTRLTVIVLSVVAVATVYVAGLDFVYSQLMKLIVK